VNKSKGRVVAGTALAAGAVWLAVSTSAFPAVAVSSTSPPASIDLQTQATLQAKGARVQVPVTFLCPGGADAYLSVSVTQRAGSVINTGYWQSQVRCTGTATTIQAPVTATNKPFKNGTAAATATLNAYYWNINLEDNDVIQIKK
jgi:hypothetical protein